MKIGFFGDGLWADGTLSLLASSGVQVAFIVPRYQTSTEACPLRAWAEKLSADYLCIKDVNHIDSLCLLKKYNVDLMVSMSFDQILKDSIIDMAPLGFINCHAGALPFYRGRNPLNWALINGETSFGITVHYIDSGIDTGDILIQEFYEISLGDHYKDLLALAIDECPKLLFKTISSLQKGKVTRVRQDSIHSQGFYCGRRREGDENIDWSSTAIQLHNFIRAISLPGPGARCQHENGRQLTVLESSLVPESLSYIGTNGEVVGRTDTGVIVKVADTVLVLNKVAWIDLNRVDSNTIGTVFVPQFPIGTRLLKI